MKKILFSLIALLVLASCDKNDPDPNKGKLDPNATILIRPAKGVQLKATVSGLTALEIVEQTRVLTFRSHWSDNKYSEEIYTPARGFSEAQIDLTIPALKMWGTDIIKHTGEFSKDFIYGTDFYLVSFTDDTIGYIPQPVIDEARVKIEAAYNDENYTEVYRLFDEAFTFLPIPE